MDKILSQNSTTTHTYKYNEHTTSQSAYPLPGPHSVPLIKGSSQGHANATFLFSFFQLSLETQNPQLPSKEDTSSVGKWGGQQR